MFHGLEHTIYTFTQGFSFSVMLSIKQLCRAASIITNTVWWGCKSVLNISNDFSNLTYYAVYFSKYDGNLLCQDLLSELRRDFFYNGQRLKNKVVREIDGVSYRYSYVLEKGVPLKWKKMAGYKLLEHSEANTDGSYQVITQDYSKNVSKITYYGTDHAWKKTEFFSPGKKAPAAVLTPSGENSVLTMKEYDEKREEIQYALFSCEIPRNITELNLLNSSAGVPSFFAQTNAGDFYYCKQEDVTRRNTVLEAIRSSNKQVVFTPERPQTEDMQADRAGGFRVNPMAFDASDCGEEKESTPIPQPIAEDTKENDSYSWGAGSEHLEKYVLEEDAPEDKLAGTLPEEETPAVQVEDDICQEDALHAEEQEEQPQAEEVVSSEALQPVIQEEPGTDAEEAYEYANICTDLPQDTAQSADLESMRLSPEERQRVRRYNVIVKPISKNIYVGTDYAAGSLGEAGNSLQSETEESPAQAPDEPEQEPLDTSADAGQDFSDDCKYQCNGVMNGCPYQAQGKMVIRVSPQESYYYFGNVTDGLREGQGRTTLQSGATAYEGGYVSDMRDGFGTYYYKTGKLCYVGKWKANKRHGTGVSFRPNDGTIHVGCWDEDIPVGMGSRFDKNGNLLFAGRWENGQRQGAGVTYHAQDGRIFVGQWVNDVLCGKGTEFDAQGNLLYTGGWENCMRNGFGTEYNEQGEVTYSGNWSKNMYDGEGTLHLQNKHTVKGSFVQGKINGQAAEFDEFGFKIYEGSWQDDVYHGEGCRFFKNGGRYQGNFVNGRPDGFLAGYDAQGRLVYIGEWEDDAFSGEGSYYVEDEKVYEGSFRHNRYHGHGVEYQNGSYAYAGNFADNMRCGFGTSYRDGKTEYVGQWKNNLYDGLGILYQQGQPKYVGEFSQGKRHGRVNTIENGMVCEESIYKEDVLCYVKKYDSENALICEGNIKNGKLNGMGCTFTPSGEKIEEGIFADGTLLKSMRVRLRILPPLPQAEILLNTEYERCRKGPDYVVEKGLDGGIYSGLLQNGLPQGKGTMLRSDHRYTGMFVSGAPCGKGILYKNDGTTLEGIFSATDEADVQHIVFAEGVSYYIKEKHMPE